MPLSKQFDRTSTNFPARAPLVSSPSPFGGSGRNMVNARSGTSKEANQKASLKRRRGPVLRHAKSKRSHEMHLKYEGKRQHRHKKLSVNGTRDRMDRNGLDRTRPDRTGPTEPSRAEPSQTEPNPADPNRSGPKWTEA